jgi:hypothetical protein
VGWLPGLGNFGWLTWQPWEFVLVSGVIFMAARVPDSTLEDLSPRFFFVFVPFSPDPDF